MRKINIVIINDVMGEETTEEFVNRLCDATGLTSSNFNVLRHENGVVEETLNAMNKTDIVIIDYGGMMPGCDDMVSFQIRAVCKWAEEHPSKLLLIWTTFTSQIYERELSDTFGHCTNIMVHYADCYSEDRDKTVNWIKNIAE